MQIEEIISNQGKLVGSNEIQNIRKNILAELSDLLTRLKVELLNAKASLTNEKVAVDDKSAVNYKQISVNEEFLLNDIHMKLNDIDFATQLAIEIRMIAGGKNSRGS